MERSYSVVLTPNILLRSFIYGQKKKETNTQRAHSYKMPYFKLFLDLWNTEHFGDISISK